MSARRFNYYLILILFCSVCFYGKDSSYGSNYKNAMVERNQSLPKISFMNNSNEIKPNITHKRVKRWLNGKPAIVNILIVNPRNSGVVIKPANGSYYIGSMKSVKDIAAIEEAIAGVNASYFKPDSGAPLGTSIVNGKIITGPLFKRVTLGITRYKEFKMAKINIKGEISIGQNVNLDLFNINQPVFSSRSFSVFTDQWGRVTPHTSAHYSHIVVQNDTVRYVKNSSVPIPKNGYVIVGPHSILPKYIKVGDFVRYNTKIIPDDWDEVEYAIGGGPYLIREGRIYIDNQKFSRSFLWTKSPRTAVGYTKKGTLVLVTIDGRRKGFSEGATITEIAKIMKELGCYNAMNLDGGTSTQMVYKGRLVNYPAVKGGSRVTNALMIIIPAVGTNISLKNSHISNLI